MLVSVGYRGSLGRATDALPHEAAETAADSIGALLGVASGLPDEIAGPLVTAGGEAFSDGLRLGMLAAAGVLAICAVLVGTLYPRTSHPTNEQLPEGADS